MKINSEFIEKISTERELHMLVQNVITLATSLKEVQKDIEKITNHLGLSQGKSETLTGE